MHILHVLHVLYVLHILHIDDDHQVTQNPDHRRLVAHCNSPRQFAHRLHSPGKKHLQSLKRNLISAQLPYCYLVSEPGRSHGIVCSLHLVLPRLHDLPHAREAAGEEDLSQGRAQPDHLQRWPWSGLPEEGEGAEDGHHHHHHHLHPLPVLLGHQVESFIFVT